MRADPQSIVVGRLVSESPGTPNVGALRCSIASSRVCPASKTDWRKFIDLTIFRQPEIVLYRHIDDFHLSSFRDIKIP
jgi:hypothetical protein